MELKEKFKRLFKKRIEDVDSNKFIYESVYRKENIESLFRALIDKGELSEEEALSKLKFFLGKEDKKGNELIKFVNDVFGNPEDVFEVIKKAIKEVFNFRAVNSVKKKGKTVYVMSTEAFPEINGLKYDTFNQEEKKIFLEKMIKERLKKKLSIKG